MKRFFAAITIVASLLMSSNVCFAANVLGNATYTDIATYINNIAIASHNFKGKTLIAVEDLSDFGFTTKWNEYRRTITLSRSNENNINIPYVTMPDKGQIGKKEFAVTTTDVKVYAGNCEFTAYGGIEGYTLIDAEDLKCFDNVSIVWVPEVKALKIWIEDGLYSSPRMIRPTPDLEYYIYPKTPKYEYYWSHSGDDKLFYLNFWVLSEDGYYVDSPDGVLKITDVIDADGNSVLNKQEWYYCETSSIVNYQMGFSDHYISSVAILTSQNLLPKMSADNGGIIKFSYTMSKYYTPEEYSIRVDALPYSEIAPNA